jgi:hypothetical protein
MVAVFLRPQVLDLRKSITSTDCYGGNYTSNLLNTAVERILKESPGLGK